MFQQQITAIPINSIKLRKQKEVRPEAEERLMDLTSLHFHPPCYSQSCMLLVSSLSNNNSEYQDQKQQAFYMVGQ